ncbi:Sarcosine oxidase [Roseibacterium elongatum DSM 19469]|uniref:Sarcosine oxidase n=1 Tax=Roseicyclus elongatus DSM 19469 TaxID=1294273 RepID=W8RPH8_9RHOB|nr:FAD-dependent oxidoreductase [Roseibacterium elongatum]AHM03064.1 Sarcosine oxidase [Roseibacterium elongatum DSM 19469]
MTARPDVAVVGRGLMGTACARHLAEAGHTVFLIGPDEPENPSRFDGPFASHHDAGRITRGLAEKADWSRLALRSIDRYAMLEEALGESFYSPCGVMMAGPLNGPGAEFTRGFLGAAKRLALPHERIDGDALDARFPYFRFPADTVAAWEALGGWIDPRALRRAEEVCATRAGATVIRDTAAGLAGDTLTLGSGDIVTAGHVVMATGGYARTSGLLPARPAMAVYARTVVLAELDPQQAARLGGMPSLIAMPEGGRMDDDVYLLPPIRYPDGRTYLKIGGEPVSPRLETDAEMTAWFQSAGSAAAGEMLSAQLSVLMPGLHPRHLHCAACVVSFTETGYPYIERLTDRLTILTGGNGAAAKSCDEIGRLGAIAATGGDLSAEGYDTDFRAVFA